MKLLKILALTTLMMIGFWGKPAAASAIPTAITLVATHNPSVFGEAVTYTAIVSDPFNLSPQGKVAFIYGTPTTGYSASYVTVDSTGHAADVHQSEASPTLGVTAKFEPGSQLFLGSQVVLSETVNPANVSVVLSAPANKVLINHSITITAKISPVFPSALYRPYGTVTFTDGTATLGTVQIDSNGLNTGSSVVTFTTQFASLGSHSIVAHYHCVPDIFVPNAFNDGANATPLVLYVLSSFI